VVVAHLVSNFISSIDPILAPFLPVLDAIGSVIRDWPVAGAWTVARKLTRAVAYAWAISRARSIAYTRPITSAGTIADATGALSRGWQIPWSRPRALQKIRSRATGCTARDGACQPPAPGRECARPCGAA
jgi:hypothetical protein